MRIRVNGSSANEESLSSSTNTEISAVGFCICLLYKPHDIVGQDEIVRMAEKKCAEYSALSCRFPYTEEFDLSSKILLGEEIPIEVFPHMAYMEFYSSDVGYKGKSCGGTLISERWILSAAHCASNLPNVHGWAKLGSESRLLDDGTGEVIGICKALLHPKYDEKQRLNDVLLVQLDRKVDFNAKIRPICLNIKLLPMYERVYATGWGRTEVDSRSENLRMTPLSIDQGIIKRCKAFRSHNYSPLICAGYPDSSRSVHAGDSGGPLQVSYPCECAYTYEIIGVAHAVENRSFHAEETLLSWYFKVEMYIPWIVTTVWKDEL